MFAKHTKRREANGLLKIVKYRSKEDSDSALSLKVEVVEITAIKDILISALKVCRPVFARL